MKLSLPVLFDDDERDYDTPCYLVTIQSRFPSRVSDDIDTRAEAKALQDFLRAALAQQAHPLTDEQRIALEHALRRIPKTEQSGRHRIVIQAILRGRIDKQAQPCLYCDRPAHPLALCQPCYQSLSNTGRLPDDRPNPRPFVGTTRCSR